MPVRRAAPSSKPSPKPSGDAEIEPTREALLAALAERERELAEALARQTATAEILRVISQSPTDARPVFESIVVTAARLLRCDMAFVLLREGDAYVHTAGATPEGPMADLAPERIPIDPNANFPSRAFLARTMLHLPDWSQIDLPEHERRIHEMFGVNSVLYLPLLRGDECIGLLAVGGRRANIFGPGEIAQAESFRDQALIAMENARLFNETQEALERQTATAEVLKVIASSPSDVQPVFDAIATSANRLLGGLTTTVWRFVNDALILVAFTRTSPSADEALQAAFPRPLAEIPPFALARDGRTEQITDTEAELGVPAVLRDLGRLRGFRSMLFAPLMSNGAAIGMISVTRKEPGAFAPADVQLLRTFADQAVIAIQNARLFNETQKALEQQTASAEILRVIASSPTDVQPVFDAIAHSAAALCEATNGTVFRLQDGLIVLVGHYSLSRTQLASLQQSFPAPLDRGTASGRAILDRAVVHIHDIAAEPGYSTALIKTGLRSVLSVPMLRDGETIGSINVSREELRPFSDRQIELLKTFADQAVIAINNVGLFNETQEALERQTATAEVLKVIASSPSDVQPVFDVIAASANRLLGGFSTTVIRFIGDALHLVAFTPTNAAADEALQAAFPRPIADFPPFILVRDGRD